MIEMGLEETVNQILDTIPSTNLKSEREVHHIVCGV